MSAIIRSVVSQNRNRFQENGFDLDLSYIEPNIIAMGFPSKKVEGIYRNKMSHVKKFLESRHSGHYRIYNLCSERSHKSFGELTETFPFPDHSPPQISQIQSFCESVHSWLSQDEKNVVVIHCKAGKGRTGTMICAYLLYSGKFDSAEKAIHHYAVRRTNDSKGVTIPSQIRYIGYFHEILERKLSYIPIGLNLVSMTFYSFPQNVCEIVVTVSLRKHACYKKSSETCVVTYTSPETIPISKSASSQKLLFCSPTEHKNDQSESTESRKNISDSSPSSSLSKNGNLLDNRIKSFPLSKSSPRSKSVKLQHTYGIPLTQDALITVFQNHSLLPQTELFHFWLNMFFIHTSQPGEQEIKNNDEYINIILYKKDLDKANNKVWKDFPDDFKVELEFISPENDLTKKIEKSSSVPECSSLTLEIKDSDPTISKYLEAHPGEQGIYEVSLRKVSTLPSIEEEFWPTTKVIFE